MDRGFSLKEQDELLGHLVKAHECGMTGDNALPAEMKFVNYRDLPPEDQRLIDDIRTELLRETARVKGRLWNWAVGWFGLGFGVGVLVLLWLRG